MDSKEYAINYLDMHHDKLTKEFIINYFTYYLIENDLFDYANNLKISTENYYNTKEKSIIINPDFINVKNIKNFMTSKTKERLKILIFLYTLKHELNHALQIKMIKENSYIDSYFKKEFENSMIAARIDEEFLNGEFYKKYHDIFLFESQADMKAIIEMDSILKELNNKYPKKIYNMYAAKKIINLYKDNQYPIKSSNQLYNKILKKVENFDNDEIEQLEYNPLQEQPTTNYTIQDLITYGYPIEKEVYNHLTDIKQGKKKVKSLF